MNFRRWSSDTGGVDSFDLFRTNAEITRKSSSTCTGTIMVDVSYLFKGILRQRFLTGGSGPKSLLWNHIVWVAGFSFLFLLHCARHFLSFGVQFVHFMASF